MALPLAGLVDRTRLSLLAYSGTWLLNQRPLPRGSSVSCLTCWMTAFTRSRPVSHHCLWVQGAQAASKAQVTGRMKGPIV